jgi:EEF1A N-terminal glycine/lysine methyltransferase
MVDHDEMEDREDVEDILGTSLYSLYGYEPITVSSAGGEYVYEKDGHTIRVKTPDPGASNWGLHASSIWASSVYLAGQLDRLNVEGLIRRREERGGRARVLELGAGAGLPGMMIAKKYRSVEVVVSDYPDERLIETLSENIRRNDVTENCRAVGYGWGSDGLDWMPEDGFEMIIAADTIWNPDLHGLFVDGVDRLLTKDGDGTVHVVAGLHTGRHTIDAFIRTVEKRGLRVRTAVERTRQGDERRWTVDGGDDGEGERRRWLIWIEICR